MNKLKDDDEISYILSQSENLKDWTLEIKCTSEITFDEIMLCIEIYINDWKKEKNPNYFEKIKNHKH